MEKPKILSGETLVTKGITKIDASLPEVGLKDVIPNGSWLEQKQVQAALEARKTLIEVERIEKCGTLSHAEWRDDLKLAEVTHITGGHWQYLGHNVGKTLYLRPEEALFLIEVNCLLLKHNDVKVSLEKAYSLLLNASMTIVHYRVYASLSRIGYKVFRHNITKVKTEKESSRQKSTVDEPEIVDTAMCITIDSDAENVDELITQVKSENEVSLINDTVNSSDNVDKPIVNTRNDSENVDAPINSQNSEISKSNVQLEKEKYENSVEICEICVNGVNNEKNNTTIDIAKEEVAETNKNIVEISEGDNDGVNFQNNNTTNDISKNKESPTVMEVDETVESNSDNITTQANNQDVETNIVSNINDTTNDISKNKEPPTVMEVDETVESNRDNITTQANNQDVETNIVSNLNDEKSSTVEDVTGKNIENHMCNINLSIPTQKTADLGTRNIDDILKDLPNTNSNESTARQDLNRENCRSQTNNFTFNYLIKIEKLTNRQLKPSDSKSIDKYFENIPDLFKKQVVALNVPQEQFIPKNIFVNNSNYMLDLQNIKKRSKRSASTESVAYTSSDEVSGTNVRRLRSSSITEFPPNPNFLPHVRFPRHLYFRPYGYWRPQNNLNYYQFNMFFQRPFPSMFFQTRAQYPPRLHPFIRSFPYPSNLNPNNSNMGDNVRKRTRSGRNAHLQYIKNLAVRLKQVVLSGNTELRHFESLQSLIHSYNIKYKSRLRLTEVFDVINEEKIVETIALDDDEESRSKKRKLDQDDSNKFDENLYRLRQLALKLKNLEDKDKATASHRRAFSKAVKTFNKSYNADVYLNDVTYEVIDRRYITVESSSDSDCVVEEPPKKQNIKGKRLRNPFNILKRRSERLASQNNASTSKAENLPDENKTETDHLELEDDSKYNEFILKTFSKDWLPNENDFGRAEVVPKQFMNVRLIDSNKEEYIYDYIKDQFHVYENWLEAKICFLRHLEETNIAFQDEQARIFEDADLSNVGLKPLIDTEDCADMASVLEKLRIIKHNKDIDTETSLNIHFDVYNRDVQNFKKRNPPKPHFRVICIESSSGFPSAAQVMALHSKYTDNVAIIFAIVSIGSISYLQINPIELPIYVPNNDVV